MNDPTSDAKVEILFQNRFLRTREEFEAFDSTVQELGPEPGDVDPAKLYPIFTDACEMPDVMWGLLHAVEHYDRDYTALLEALPAMLTEAAEWAELLHIRLLNSEQCTAKYKIAFAKANSSHRQIVQEYLESLIVKFPECAAAIHKVLATGADP